MLRYLIKIFQQVRFDLEEFDMTATSDGGCLMDTMTIINSAGGHGGKICGRKKNYSYLAQASENEPLGLSVLVQSPSYRWSIKVTQIQCDQVIFHYLTHQAWPKSCS